MLIVVLLIGIILVVVGVKSEEDSLGDYLGCIGLISLFSLIPVIVLSICFSNVLTINDHISLYEAQNQQIQQEISAIVENYQDHETEVFIRESSPITLVEAYPELKSNELVVKQIDLYVQNNEKLLELKEAKINLKVYGWWLFFNIGVSYE